MKSNNCEIVNITECFDYKKWYAWKSTHFIEHVPFNEKSQLYVRFEKTSIVINTEMIQYMIEASYQANQEVKKYVARFTPWNQI